MAGPAVVIAELVVARSSLMDPADDLIDSVQQLHSPPHVATRLLKLTRTPDYDLEEVEECLLADPALTAKILRLANSSYSGLAQRVGSVRMAVNYLGHRTLRLTVLTFGLLEQLTRGVAARQYSDFWHRALAASAAAARVARRTSEVDPSEAFAASLLADLGSLVILQGCGEPYAALLEGRQHGPELLEAERNLLGFDHAHLGGKLGGRWRLPQPLIEAIAGHHRLEDPWEPDLQGVVRASHLLAEVVWRRPCPLLPQARQALVGLLGLDVDGFVDLVRETTEDLRGQAEAFEVTLRQPVDCRQLLADAAAAHSEAALETALELDSLESVLGG